MDVKLVKDKGYLFKRYGTILGTSVSPLSIFTTRYFEKNYGKVLELIPKNSVTLEIGPGNASFTQYLLYKGYRNITVCEIADDNAQSLSRFFGDRIRVINEDVISYLGNSSDKHDFIYAAQLIEHFTYDEFIKFLEICYTALNEGGYIIFETINCANITHGLYLRYCDYTHRMGFTPRSLKHFFMAVGNYSNLELIEIYPPGFLDCLYYVYHKIKGDSITFDLNNGFCPVPGSGDVRRGLRRLMAIILKNPGIRFSRWLSFLFLGPYEFEGINVYTPFFAIVARKA